MYTMSVDFVGDCTSLVNAANNSMAAIRRADGMSATMGISAPGAPSVIQQLTSVGDLQKSISGVSTVDVKVGAGVGALQGELSASRTQVRSLGNDLRALGGVGIGSSTGVSQLMSDLGGAAREATQFSGTMSRVQQAVGAMDTRMVSQNMRGISASASELGQTAGLLEKQLVPVGARMEQTADGSALASARVGQLASNLGGVSRQAGGAADGLREVISENSRLNDEFYGITRGLESGVGGPPRPPGPPRGGGGGGGSGAFGGAFDETARSVAPEGINAGALSTLAMPGAMLAAVGLVEPLAAAAGGLMAVNQVVKNTPGLMLEANRAMNSFNDGVRSASVGALSQGVPAFQQLGRALEPLGAEVGRIGTAQIGTVLGGAAELARGATTALQSLEPAFGPSIRGAVALGDAILAGIASPGVAQGIANVGTMLQDPNVEKGVAAATGGILQMATQTASLLGPVVGAVGPALGGAGPTGASATGDQWYNEPAGKLLADHSGGILSYDQQQDYGGGFLPGTGGGVSVNQQSKVGQVMTAMAATGQLLMDPIGQAAKLGMNPLSQQAYSDASRSLNADANDFGARWSTVFNRRPAPANGIGTDQNPDPGSAPSVMPPGRSQFGWQQNPDGSYAELGRPTTNLAPQTGSPVFQPQQTLPGGPGSSVMSVSATQANQLNAAIQQSAPIAQNSASALGVFGQSAMSSASQVQQLGQSGVSTFSLLGDTSTNATQQLSSASSAITSGSQALGSSVPQAMSQGITANTGAACDATANLGANAVNCAKSALDAHSPSRKFVDLGMGTGEGFALGVNDSAGLAASSVAQSMNGAIAAASGALNSNSPSKAFQNLAANAFGQNLPGGQFQNQAVSQLNSVYGQQTQASLPQSQIQARNDEERAKQEAVQARAQASAAQASRGGLTNQQLQQLPPDVQAALRAGVPLSDAQRQSLGYDSWRQQRGDALDKFHWSDHTKTDVLNREEARKERADQRHLEGRDPDSLKDNAKARLHSDWGHKQADAMRKQGDEAGKSYVNGTADHIRAGMGKVGAASRDTMDNAADEMKKKAGINSPARLTMPIGAGLAEGVAVGLSGGMSSVGSSIAPVASNTGLMVGYVFGENMVTGTLAVIKSADYQTAAVTGIGSKLAETALGRLGMLGPAGSGASIPKNAAITLTESGATSGTVPQVNIEKIEVTVDGAGPMQTIAKNVVGASLEGLTTSITMQG